MQAEVCVVVTKVLGILKRKNIIQKVRRLKRSTLVMIDFSSLGNVAMEGPLRDQPSQLKRTRRN